jgi:hypothetical protein
MIPSTFQPAFFNQTPTIEDIEHPRRETVSTYKGGGGDESMDISSSEGESAGLSLTKRQRGGKREITLKVDDDRQQNVYIDDSELSSDGMGSIEETILESGQPGIPCYSGGTTQGDGGG